MSDHYGDKAWFGPKSIGYGWKPITWQGWASTLVFALAIWVTAMLADSSLASPRSAALLSR